MIYDSEAQKSFIQDCVRKYPTTYENAIKLANSFGPAIQNGQVVPEDDQGRFLDSLEKEPDGIGPE